MKDPNLLVGMEEPDDAAVYKLTDEIAIIQTVDFFTPLVDDPFLFGQIAAANSLSDVYAMGGKPLTAMNIFCFPAGKMPHSVAKSIIAGGLDIMNKAGCLLVGGHSVMDDEIKYGLSVTGTIHPDKVLTKKGVNNGDAVILTKPLGTGIISTAVKASMYDESSLAAMVESMITLNKTAAEIMQQFPVTACTDVTGFGLLGHLFECLQRSGMGAIIDSQAVPFLEKAYDYASMGLLPGGLYRNRDFYSGHLYGAETVDDVRLQLFFDPQTSGGLLIFVEQSQADGLVSKLKSSGVESAVIIGRITDREPGKITLRQ